MISATGGSSTISTLNVTGDTTLGDASGDAVTLNASTISIPNNLNIDSNTLYIDAANNNIGIGTTNPTYKLEVSGIARCQRIYTYGTDLAEVVPMSLGQRPIAHYYKDSIDFTKLTEVGADMALEGLVVSLDAENPGHMKITDTAYDSAIAGAVSSGPGSLLGSTLDGIQIALIGKVPIWADTSKAAIQVGDLLVSSSIPGCVMKADTDIVRPGMVLGKAMEPAAKSDKPKKIEVWINLQ